MGAMNDRATEDRPSERRNRRSTCLADALRFQLDACRQAEGLAAIVVSDELGFCVAYSGGDGTHEELAARLPMLADPARRQLCEDAVDEETPSSPSALRVTTFPISGTMLHVCAVGAPQAGAEDDAGVAVLARVASGFTRLLA